jgi:hypothetical protein
MIASTNQEIIETTVGSPRTTSKNNLLAILFFIMGAPHIYGIMQSRSGRRKFVKAYSNRISISTQLSHNDAILAANTSRSFLGRYLTIGLGALLTAGFIEIFMV